MMVAGFCLAVPHGSKRCGVMHSFSVVGRVWMSAIKRLWWRLWLVFIAGAGGVESGQKELRNMSVCPSGLRGYVQVVMFSDSWVQIPQPTFCGQSVKVLASSTLAHMTHSVRLEACRQTTSHTARTKPPTGPRHASTVNQHNRVSRDCRRCGPFATHVVGASR